MDDSGVQTRKLKRAEYDRLVEAEVFGPEDATSTMSPGRSGCSSR